MIVVLRLFAWRASRAWWPAALVSIAACSVEDPAGPAGQVGDGGGAAGTGPSCPLGSHPDGPEGCAATLAAWQAAPSMASARDHHVTFAVETPGGAFLYVAGGAVDMKSAVASWRLI